MPAPVRRCLAAILLVLLAGSAAAAPASEQELEQAVMIMLRMGAYREGAIFLKAGQTRQTLQRQPALPRGERWLFPAEAVPVLSLFHMGDYPTVMSKADQLATQAHGLQLADQELALRLLGLQAALHADLPLEVRARIPKVAELARDSPGTVGGLARFLAASCDTYQGWLKNPRVTPDQLAAAFAQAAGEFPSAPPDAYALSNSLMLFLWTSQWLLGWGVMLGVSSPDGSVPPGFERAFGAAVKWVATNPTHAAGSNNFEPVLAALVLQLETMEGAEQIRKIDTMLTDLEKRIQGVEEGLKKAHSKVFLRDLLAGLQSRFYLAASRAALDQKPPDVATAQTLVNRANDYARMSLSGPVAVDMAAGLTRMVLGRGNEATLEGAAQGLEVTRQLPTLTRSQKIEVLTLLGRLRKDQGKAEEARNLAAQARALVQEYVAEAGSPELSRLRFGDTERLCQELGL